MDKQTEIYDKWRIIGMLEGLIFKNQVKLANAYEHMAKILLADAEKEIRFYNDDIDTIGFPVLRRYFGLNLGIELTNELVEDILKELHKYQTSDFYTEGKLKLNLIFDSGLDMEAILLKVFCEDIYGQ